jgi:gamma-glutamyltranspeptidase/glutathione hydrolase
MLNLMPRVHHAMVAAPHYIASAVGSSVLHSGGNAFDASVAVSAVLSVVAPHMTGIGGDAFFLAYDAKTGECVGYNGSGRSGRLANADLYRNEGLTSIPHRGVRSAITVPGMVDAWWRVWERYGRLPWERLIEPAVRYAEEGFPVTRNLREWIAKDRQLLEADAGLRRVYLPSGRVPREGERIANPDLAATLRAVMKDGRGAFYEGEIMAAVTSAVEADGGLLTADDFRLHAGEWVRPISVAYRGYDIRQMPPNSQGFSVLMMLNMIESFDVAAYGRLTAEYFHLMTEVIKIAFRERDACLTDPDFGAIPLDKLLSKAYAGELLKSVRIHPPLAGSFRSQPTGSDTAYAAVVDEEGNAVSFIQSLYFDFGSAYTAGDTGIIMQNRGSYFSLDERSPNLLQPRKRTFHTLMPGLVLRGGKPFLLAGSQGGEGQPQTSLAILTGVIDFGLTIQDAICMPRWVYGRTWGEDSDVLRLENRLGDGVAETLRRWGHRVEVVGRYDGVVGTAQGIMIDDGVISGAADPRGDGCVVGW